MGSHEVLKILIVDGTTFVVLPLCVLLGIWLP